MGFNTKDGREFIAELIEDITPNTHYTIRNPITISPVPDNRTGQMSFAMIRTFPMSAKQEFRLDRSFLVVEPYVPHDEIKNSYIEATSNIKLPNKNIIQLGE